MQVIKISSVAELEGILLDMNAFIQTVNDLLPRYLSLESAEKAAVSVRLTRYFQTNGLLDEPFKEGREARYGARHVLQLLAVRRLMANGYSIASLSNLLLGATNEALQRLIEGEAPRIDTALQAPPSASSNDALDFLDKVRSRSQGHSLPSAPARSLPAPSPAPALPSTPAIAQEWKRTEIARGVELHLRADFETPRSPHEWDVLIEAFKTAVREASAPDAKKRRR